MKLRFQQRMEIVYEAITL